MMMNKNYYHVLKNCLARAFFLFIVFYSIKSDACQNGMFTQLPTSPYAAGTQPADIVYSPLIGNNLFAAVTNSGSNTVSTYSVNTTTGIFTLINSYAAGTEPLGMNYSPLVNGNLFLAAVNGNSNNVSVYQQDTNTGVLTQVPGSPFATGSAPFDVAYCLVNGNMFAAVTNGGSNSVWVYSVDQTTGVFTFLNSYATGTTPYGVRFSPLLGTNLFAAVTNHNSANVSVYSVNTTTGAFTPIAGSPFAAQSGPYGVSYSPVVNGNLYVVVSNMNSNSISGYSVNTSTGAFTPIVTLMAGAAPTDITFSQLLAGNLLIVSANSGDNTLSVYQFNPNTGSLVLTTVPSGSVPTGTAFSPLLSNANLFFATANYGSASISVYTVQPILPIITTPSQTINYGSSIDINATIYYGTAPFTVVWSDGYTQTATSNFVTRLVSPTVPTLYQIATATDANGCTSGPSNSIIISEGFTLGQTTFFGDEVSESRDDHICEPWNYGFNLSSTTVTASGSNVRYNWTIAGSGTITSPVGLVTLATGTTTASTAAVQSNRYIRYQPGRQCYAVFSALFSTGIAGCNQLIGCYDVNDGFAVGYNGTTFSILYRSSVTGSVVNVYIPQSNFNVDPLNGTGPSGITLNPQKMNIFRIEYSWLGVSPIKFSIMNNTGQFKPFHIIQAPNSMANTITSLPFMPLRSEVNNNSTTSNVNLSMGCWVGGIVETYRNPSNGRVFMVSNAIPMLTTLGIQTHILTIQNPALINGITNKIEARLTLLGGGAMDPSGAASTFQLLLNATVSGTSFTPVNAGNSIMNVSTAGTYSIGTGTTVLNFPNTGFGNGPAVRYFDNKNNVIDLVILPGQILTITGAVPALTNYPIIGILGWDERY